MNPAHTQPNLQSLLFDKNCYRKNLEFALRTLFTTFSEISCRSYAVEDFTCLPDICGGKGALVITADIGCSLAVDARIMPGKP